MAPADSVSGKGPFSNGWLFPTTSHEGTRDLSKGRRDEGPLIRGLIPFMKTPPLWLYYLPKAPSPNAITLGVGFQPVWGGHNIQSVTAAIYRDSRVYKKKQDWEIKISIWPFMCDFEIPFIQQGRDGKNAIISWDVEFRSDVCDRQVYLGHY